MHACYLLTPYAAKNGDEWEVFRATKAGYTESLPFTEPPSVYGTRSVGLLFCGGVSTRSLRYCMLK